MTGPPNENGAGVQAAPRERLQSGQDRNRIIALSIPRRKRDGILNYRQQRTPGEICAAITNALNREVRLACATGTNTPPQVFEDLSHWVERGCLP